MILLYALLQFCNTTYKLRLFPAYPIEVGMLETHRYNAAGEVTILDEKRIKISDMTYNGKYPLSTNFCPI